MNSGTVNPYLGTTHSLGKRGRHWRIVCQEGRQGGKGETVEELCRQNTFPSFINALPPLTPMTLATSLIIDVIITPLILCQALLSYIYVFI